MRYDRFVGSLVESVSLPFSASRNKKTFNTVVLIIQLRSLDISESDLFPLCKEAVSCPHPAWISTPEPRDKTVKVIVREIGDLSSYGE